MNPKQIETLTAVFGYGGVLEKAGMERRESQVTMARHVAKTIFKAEQGEKTSLLVEGKTGTGKSFAYLAPAIEHVLRLKKEGKPAKVFVATSSIPLQEQLVAKDLPLLKKLTGWDFSWAMVKGRSNYLCLNRYANLLGKLSGEETKVIDLPEDGLVTLAKINAWTDFTTTGDKSELDFNPGRMWQKVSVGSEDCLGKACKNYKECYAQRARTKMIDADIVVINYHVLLASWAVQHEFLPDRSVLICDEVHELPEIARAFRTEEMSEGTFKWVVSRCMPYVNHAALTDLEEEGQAVLARAAAALDATVDDSLRGKLRYEGDPLKLDQLLLILGYIYSELAPFEDSVTSTDERVKVGKLKDDLDSLISRVKLYQKGSTVENVCWAENSAAGVKDGVMKPMICTAPVQVAGWLQKGLFRDGQATILTSATINSGGDFSYIASQIGTPKTTVALNLPSPFALKEQGVLWIPGRIADKSDWKAWRDETHQLIQEAITQTPGGVLALFTSNAAMDAAAKALRPFIEYEEGRQLLVQGDGGRGYLLDVFKNDVRSVLFATRSFFVGVDIPGDALQTVIIDSLPFPVPTDPIVQAVQAAYEEQNENGWRSYSLPLMCLTLAQAAGRLIRSAKDKGALVILDPRAAEAAYAPRIRESLPPFPLVRSIADFRDSMKKIK